jgi:hypothetical protein
VSIKLDDGQGPVVVVAHDAGGAETISSYVLENNIECRYSIHGPAYQVFERKLGRFINFALDDAILNARILLCGTSWQSDIELRAIRIARAQGCYSIAWLDHWVNYSDRFKRGVREIFPDEVWVSDDLAYAIATKELPQVKLQKRENPYFKDINGQLSRALRSYKPVTGKLNVLFVSEPVSDHASIRYGNPLYWGYTEEQALRYFLSNVHVLGSQLNRVVIRPHPAESSTKYVDVVAEFRLPIYLSKGRTLVEDVAFSDCVVGCNSMAMVVGLLAGKRVISSIPPNGAECKLPHGNIEHLHEMVLVSGS